LKSFSRLLVQLSGKCVTPKTRQHVQFSTCWIICIIVCTLICAQTMWAFGIRRSSIGVFSNCHKKNMALHSFSSSQWTHWPTLAWTFTWASTSSRQEQWVPHAWWKISLSLGYLKVPCPLSWLDLSCCQSSTKRMSYLRRRVETRLRRGRPPGQNIFAIVAITDLFPTW